MKHRKTEKQNAVRNSENMNVEQTIDWLIGGLKPPSKISSLEIMEKAHALERKILSEQESDFSVETAARLRAFRCQRKSPLLERIYDLYDINGHTVRCTVATVLFNIEILMTHKLSVDRWNDEIQNTDVKFSDLVPASKANLLVFTPENQNLRMPMSQLLENLKRLVEDSNLSCIRKQLTIVEYDAVVDALFDRMVLFSTLDLAEDDCDISDYRLPAEVEDETAVANIPLFRTNYLFLSEMRLYFDTLFEKSLLWKEQQNHFAVEPVERKKTVTAEELKKFLETYCKNFERECFLETFTDYILDSKLNSRLLTELYRNKYPDVSKPDSRRIVKHFMGQEAVIDYSNYQYISDLFHDEDVDYAYEFAVLFYLLMIYQENPTSRKVGVKGYIVSNPMNPEEYTYFNCKHETLTPYGTFLDAVAHYFNQGHSKSEEFGI